MHMYFDRSLPIFIKDMRSVKVTAPEEVVPAPPTPTHLHTHPLGEYNRVDVFSPYLPEDLALVD